MRPQKLGGRTFAKLNLFSFDLYNSNTHSSFSGRKLLCTFSNPVARLMQPEGKSQNGEGKKVVFPLFDDSPWKNKSTGWGVNQFSPLGIVFPTHLIVCVLMFSVGCPCPGCTSHTELHSQSFPHPVTPQQHQCRIQHEQRRHPLHSLPLSQSDVPILPIDPCQSEHAAGPFAITACAIPISQSCAAQTLDFYHHTGTE